MTDLRFSMPATTLVGVLWPERTSSIARAVRTTLLVLFGTLILFASARIAVPFYPVPMTMQSLAVLLIGAVYGGRLGTATVLAYLLEGAVGLPVFAGTPERGIGLAYMMGPTGGFLLGFLVAAAVVGVLADRGADRSIARLFAAALAGHAVIFILGFFWLSTLIGPDRAYDAGVAPFLLGTAVKTLLVALAVPAVWGLVRRR